MPLYTYKCKNGHYTDEIRRVDDRRKPTLCDECSSPATIEVQRTHVDPRMGLSNDFPTMTSRWIRTHERAAKGKQ